MVRSLAAPTKGCALIQACESNRESNRGADKDPRACLRHNRLQQLNGILIGIWSLLSMVPTVTPTTIPAHNERHKFVQKHPF